MSTYGEGWRLGLNQWPSIEMVSKRIGALNTRKTKDMGTADDVDLSTEKNSRIISRVGRRAGHAAKSCRPTDAHRMSETRMSLTHKFEIAVMKVTSPLACTKMASRRLFIPHGQRRQHHRRVDDTIGTLDFGGLQYGVPLESLVKKFAYQRIRAERLHQKSRYPECEQHHRLRLSLARCQFIKGYKEATRRREVIPSCRSRIPEWR